MDPTPIRKCPGPNSIIVNMCKEGNSVPTKWCTTHPPPTCAQNRPPITNRHKMDNMAHRAPDTPSLPGSSSNMPTTQCSKKNNQRTGTSSGTRNSRAPQRGSAKVQLAPDRSKPGSALDIIPAMSNTNTPHPTLKHMHNGAESCPRESARREWSARTKRALE